LSISLSRFGFLSNGRTIACLKDAGTHCSDSDLLTISVIDGNTGSKQGLRSFVGNGSSSQDFHDDVQSAYRAYHSTETALLRVHHDIAYALDSNCCAVLLMLDLSAAFDTIDHQILFNRLEYSTGVTKDALLWFKSYLMDRTQRVAPVSLK
jgi:hypothetical protein